MEPWDHEPRVRPVPIEDDEAAPADAVPSMPRSESRINRPWLPIVLSGVAVVVVLASITVFGAVEHEDPPPLRPSPFSASADPTTDTSPPATLAPSLEEIIPDITDRLTLIVVGADGPAALLWDPSFIEPKHIDLEIGAGSESDYTAAFDSSGRYLALTSSPIGSAEATLYVGVPTEVAETDIQNVLGFQWHATEVGRIAWIEADDGGGSLLTGTIDPLSRSLSSVRTIGPVDSGFELTRWDSDGFVVSDTDPGIVYALDNSGTEMWALPGHVVATSANTILISPEPADTAAVSFVESVTRSGDLIATVLDQAADDGIQLRTMRMSRNSDMVARIDVRSDRTRLEVQGPQIAAIRIIQVNEDLPPIGFTSNDEFFVFHDSNNDLVFIRWNSSAIFDLDVPDGFSVIGFDIG